MKRSCIGGDAKETGGVVGPEDFTSTVFDVPRCWVADDSSARFARMKTSCSRFCVFAVPKMAG